MLSEYTYYSYEDQCCKSKIFDLDPNLPQFESGYGSEPFHYVKNVSVLIKTVKFAFEEKYASKIFKITFYKLHIRKFQIMKVTFVLVESYRLFKFCVSGSVRNTDTDPQTCWRWI